MEKRLADTASAAWASRPTLKLQLLIWPKWKAAGLSAAWKTIFWTRCWVSAPETILYPYASAAVGQLITGVVASRRSPMQ